MVLVFEGFREYVAMKRVEGSWDLCLLFQGMRKAAVLSSPLFPFLGPKLV